MTTARRLSRRHLARALRALAPCLLATACATSRPEGEPTDTARAPGSAAGARGTDGAASPAAPATSGSPVALELDRARYAPGATVRLQLVNRSDVGYGYNACTRAIQRRDGGAWTAVAEPDRICTMELRLLAARATATQDTELPQPLAAGEYRLVVTLSREEGPPPGPGMPTPGPVLATSAPFRVE